MLLAGGQACLWSKKAPKKFQNKVIALSAYRTEKSKLKRKMEHRQRSCFCESTENRFRHSKTTRERKSHNLAGSRDSLIPVGSWQEFADAENIVLCEGPPDALAVAAILPAGWLAVTNTNGAKAFDEANVNAFKNKNVYIVMDADPRREKRGSHTCAVALQRGKKSSDSAITL